MKVFLSWSGIRSQLVANALREWLPNVLQAVDPWLSSSDINVGARWTNELAFQLQESSVGVICLTPENLSAPWILFEAGALTKQIESAYVCPYLYGFSPSELHGPFVQFQATTSTRDGTLALMHTLNRALGKNSIDESRLEMAFQMWWPDLEMRFQQIQDKTHEKETQATDLTDLSKAIEKTPPDKVIDLLQDVIKKLSGSSDTNISSETPEVPKERVFLVHGHNEAIKESVARFVEHLGPAVIILHEQPNKGRTIIEKFESQSAVDYAIVLLTADDTGGLKSNEETSQRARQNVIFELGFFTARLGRSRVVVMIEEGVEIPSDFSGILYIPIDSDGAWQFYLARELKSAGIRIDLNNAL